MQKILVILVAFVLSVGAAHAQAKQGEPGYYSQNSKVYAEYIASCGYNVEVGGPKLRDEAAHKLEKLKVTNPKQYDLQVEACQANMPKQAKAKAEAAKVTKVAVVKTETEEEETETTAPQPQHAVAGGALGPTYTSFNQVAAESLHVQSHGVNYNLKQMHGRDKCPLPRHWHRTEQCTSIGGGGVRCKMVCK